MLRDTRFLLLFLTLTAQTQPFASPYNVPLEELWKSGVLGKAEIRSGDLSGVVSLQVVVNAQGAVESVRDPHGIKSVFKQAEAAERLLRFQPFQLHGKAVAATFRDTVSVIPEEQWGPRQPFPEIKNWQTLSITLERREWCDHPSCVAYRIELRGDGSVLFTRTKWASSHPAQLSARLGQQKIRQLLDEFRRADFFSMRDQYVYSITDASGTLMTVSFDDHHKSVLEWVGHAAGAPAILDHLEQIMNQVAITNKWIQPREE